MPAVHTIGVGSVERRPDGILHVIFDFEGPVTETLIDEFLSARTDAVGHNGGEGQEVAVVIEARRIPFAARKLRRRFIEGMAPPICRALVTPDVTQQVIFRTFQLMNPSSVPSRVFSSVEAAVEWIEEQYPHAVRTTDG